MYQAIAGIIGIIAALVSAFFYGKSSGAKLAKAEKTAEQRKEKLEELKARELENERTAEAISDAREHVNSGRNGDALDELRQSFNRDRKK
ncbi:I-spanin [Serratia phage vB_SmaS_Niamh]|uniref:Uncharacterized protein n=1 Tax=Serratia phage vB_SmaS_Ulliraptor TaxID=2902694 RepID=A0AC61TP09_9CAUD|nr:hypothetical protein QJS27_gp64 [Serratia phage vB_SmaS_Ulliraptor]QPX74368.1 hypothetical protein SERRATIANATOR_4 [Serratia phage vB_SmaS_Serratianator]UGO52056.1 hypothetical protein ULLIRAPTOR_64 [Serratia phage vB_SmaS_Ulliraptor]UGO53021.1 I-spanin [Serratia phage vB_SmaS_Niamh]